MADSQVSPRPTGRWINAQALLTLTAISLVSFAAMHYTGDVALVACLRSVQSSGEEISSSSLHHRRLSDDIEIIPVYTHARESSSLTVRKQIHDLKQTMPSDKVQFDVHALTTDQQQSFLQQNCKHAIARFDEFVSKDQEFFAEEIFKWCALSKTESDVAVYVDVTSPLLHRLHDVIVQTESSILVKADEELFGEGALTTSLVVLRRKQKMAQQMLKVLLDTPADILQISPLLVPRTLFSLVGAVGDSWTMLQSSCSLMHRSKTTGSSADRLLHDCPSGTGFCCYIHDGSRTLSVSRFPLLPVIRLLDASALPKPFNSNSWSESELPYITILEQGETEKRSGKGSDLTIYEKLQRDCSPKVLEADCSKCLRDKKGANCDSCRSVCKCFCEKLCSEKPPEFDTITYYIKPPAHARDPRRLIPRIVHQTWFEPLQDDRAKYPNMSRLTESFRKSGWEYKFYSDDDSVAFLDAHFPPAVREAYDALIPGAFKADLFRYCVLLIYGGVYADVDILLETSLDSIPIDVGFMVPLDEPGKPVNHQMCLWNGLMAVAPGHPILAKVIETVVNQVRNRYTSVDVDSMFCPDPELSILHAFDTLWTSGPCSLGSTLNRVLGRHGQEPLKPGEIDPWKDHTQRQKAADGTSFVDLGDGDQDPSYRIPGRIVLLNQNKWDMGAHRFTLLEKNLVIAATDLPDSNDREKLKEEDNENESKSHEHYSKTHASVGVYGVEHLYTDKERARQNIRFVVQGETVAKRTMALATLASVK